jgi:uncharacterized SAM-binding protein YcdF (DUF218 family)
MLLIGLSGLVIVTWSPADWLLSRPLEVWYQRPFKVQQDAQAIVVPGSGVEPARSHSPVALLDSSSYARCRYAAWLYHHWKKVPIVVSGGTTESRQQSVATVMARMLEAEGIPAADIIQETRSLNTYENALYTAELLRSRGIMQVVLIMEADNMLRGELVFRKQHLNIVPAPFRQRSLGFARATLLPSWASVRRNETTLHETLALFWYKVRGWI